MRHAGTASGTAMRPRVTALFALILLTLVLGPPAQAQADGASAEGDTTVRIRAFPSAVLVTAANADETDATPSRKSATLRLDTEEDFETISERMPWVIGLIFLVVASIFLTPIVLLVGIIWYKLRKARLQNEAMLALAEKGVVPPAQAAEALAAGASPASVAPTVYQQAIALRKRAVWSDLRKGVILSTLGLALSFYELTSAGGPSWIGLVLLFVGAGYVALWWLEGRHLDQTKSGGDSGQPGMSGS
ncbi:MAG TPA: hypothetical protein VL742_21045 [Casimicrobiaceae bacterium]|nr:hypothetical protein [Casimicrobiaceae bacterium]